MKNKIQQLYDRIKPLNFSLQRNTLKGPKGVLIEYLDDQRELFSIKKYPNYAYTGDPVTWGIEDGLSFEDTLSVLRQIFLDIKW